MSDPAIEAARGSGSGWYSAREVAAAREMAKPIREWFQRKYAEALEEDLYDNRDLLDELAPMIFTTEEFLELQLRLRGMLLPD